MLVEFRSFPANKSLLTANIYQSDAGVNNIEQTVKEKQKTQITNTHKNKNKQETHKQKTQKHKQIK